ncbi:RsiV family protein [Pseudomonas sp. 21LCFQ02]|uniref:RsiV family protein n=1 Tax=unclassified Pseudomonas TaxID=196821 RepID=UPI0004F8182B|nr:MULTISPECIES: RsiV family protein [unclassified Pseudomonas]MCO8162687.1 RsiV family protein [Pseudomonas sp. 21LCFQ010]MCO8167743.1 RsiV family protein [Pseudomonas sp. 21LCFQ02]BAP43038.1 lipoprotein [Pseudomonas sp. StFLB209]
MSLTKIAALACLAVTLGACQSLFKPNMRAPLQVEREAWEQIKPGCSSADCPLVNIDTVHFPDEPRLDAIVQKNLLQMAPTRPGAAPATSLKAYEQQFLSQSEGRNSSYLQAKVREQHDGIVVIELSSYLDSGGAHGDPGRALFNYSRQQQKVLTLADMVVPGKENEFWQKAQLAHQAWMVSTKANEDPQFASTWPFKRTPNVALTYGAVILKYPVTTIAPYAMGHIELKIPYPQLNGVIRPELFPGRG